MKVGFGAYAEGVLFMDSVLSIIGIIPWIFSEPVSCCVTANVGNVNAKITSLVSSPPLEPCNHSKYSGNSLDRSTKWLSEWLSSSCITSHWKVLQLWLEFAVTHDSLPFITAQRIGDLTGTTFFTFYHDSRGKCVQFETFETSASCLKEHPGHFSH